MLPDSRSEKVLSCKRAKYQFQVNYPFKYHPTKNSWEEEKEPAQKKVGDGKSLKFTVWNQVRKNSRKSEEKQGAQREVIWRPWRTGWMRVNPPRGSCWGWIFPHFTHRALCPRTKKKKKKVCTSALFIVRLCFTVHNKSTCKSHLHLFPLLLLIKVSLRV